MEGKSVKEIETALETREIEIYTLNEAVSELETELHVLKKNGSPNNKEYAQKVRMRVRQDHLRVCRLQT